MWRKLVALTALAGGGRGSTAPTDFALANEIERQVGATRPDIPLQRYARFYARVDDETVAGVYAYANEGYEPIAGRAGEIVWTSREALPVIHDGGCTVLSINFDVRTNRLTRLECNSDVGGE